MADSRSQRTQAFTAASGLPAEAMAQERPWPVVVLTAVGAWLAAIPLMVSIVLLLEEHLQLGPAPYILGAILLLAALAMLRARNLPLFVEQLAIPLLLVGLGSLGLGVFRDLPRDAAAALLASLTVLLALPLARPWLCALLGAAAAVLSALALLPGPLRWNPAPYWLALHGLLAIWLASGTLQTGLLDPGPRARAAAALEAVRVGWLLATLAGLALLSGPTFLAPGVFGREPTEIASLLFPQGASLMTQIGSALLSLGAVGWMLWAWPRLRSAGFWGVAFVLMVLSWLLPHLGGVLLALAVTATTRSWRLATVAAAAAVWVLGSFYYLLAWPLMTKGLVMAGSGVLLGSALWYTRHGSRLGAPPRERAPAPGMRLRAASIGLSAALSLVVVNLGIWQKETLIAEGMPLYVRLLPVDPRSLMQGDYMRLRFDLPAAIEWSEERSAVPVLLAEVEGRGIVTAWREGSENTILEPQERRVRLKRLGGRWGLVSDAWYFREGEAECWQQARYGEFRLLPDGRALLVGMADERLHRIAPRPPIDDPDTQCVEP